MPDLLLLETLDALKIVDCGPRVVVGDDPESIDPRLLFLANRLTVLANLDRFAEPEH